MKKNDFLHLLDKLDMLDERLDSVNDTLIKQEHNLKEHMRRTELLEEQVGPLNRLKDGAYGVASVLGLIGILVGIYEVFKK